MYLPVYDAQNFVSGSTAVGSKPATNEISRLFLITTQEMASAEALGEEVARALLKEGAREILEEAKRANSAAV